jgi:hypothetical protein
MAHLNDNEIRSLIDKEAPGTEASRLQIHLESCPDCRRRYALFEERASWVNSVVTGSRTPAHRSPLSAEAAYNRFSSMNRPISKEGKSMENHTRPKKFRPAYIGLATLVAIFGLLAIPQVRAAAIDLLGLFRIQQIAVVEVDPRNLPEQLGSSNIFEELIAKNATVEELGETKILTDPGEAKAQAGFPARLPKEAPAQAEFRLQPGSRVTLEVDLPQVKRLMTDLGYEDLELPDDLDGVEVILALQPALAARYGSCRFDDERSTELGASGNVSPSDCIVLIQMPSPTVSAPESLDLPQIGKAFLQVMGLSASEAEEFSRTVDWTSTLVIPIPRYGSTYRTVDVDGMEGTLILQDAESQLAHYLLIWLKDGILYSISGQGSWQEGVSLGNSLD